MRCCKSQNRENKRDGASGYGEDYNAVVRKKYGVHHGTNLQWNLTPSDVIANAPDLTDVAPPAHHTKLRQLQSCV